ncbi:MAG: nitroreductase family protein [Oscillospiraceae bacterium]
MVDITFEKELCICCGKCVRTCAMGHLRMTEDGPAVSPRAQCMDCLQCAAACPRRAIRRNGEAPYEPVPEDALERLVMSRRSVRHFKPEAPDKALIQWALQRAGYAPSGKNRHDNRWTVVYGTERVEAVRARAIRHCEETGEAPELLRFSQKGLDLLTCGAPVILIGWSPDDCLNPCVDTAIAMETAELLLVSRGLGTCWGGYLRQITGHCPELKAMLGIPDGCSMRGCMMVGYPDKTSFPNIPTRPEADIFWA